MNGPIEDSNYSGLKREVEALRQRLGEMEYEQTRSRIASRATGVRRFSRNRVLAIPLAIAGVLLTLSVLRGESGQPDALFIDQNGNVGIGTRTPGFPLSFSDKTGAKISLGGQTGSGYGLGTQPGLLQIYSPDQQSNIALGYGKSGAFTETMRIKGDGNVGIGTAEPSQRLQVTGGNGVINRMFIGDVGHGEKWAGISNSKSVSKEGYALLQNDGGTYTVLNKKSGVGYIGFRVDNVDKMIVADDGNVGIGTTDPKTKLQVNGDIKLGGDGSMYASAATENLRMARGSVSADGQILTGKGFSVGHKRGTGLYQIKFDTAFSDIPSAAASQIAKDSGSAPGDNALIDSLAKTDMIVIVGSSSTRGDRAFSFIVVGPR
jgi:hypothetical protein